MAGLSKSLMGRACRVGARVRVEGLGALRDTRYQIPDSRYEIRVTRYECVVRGAANEIKLFDHCDKFTSTSA